jgi:SAM-dependent methyltransferase
MSQGPKGSGARDGGEPPEGDPWGPLARALLDHFGGAPDVRVRVVTDLGDPEWLPAAHFFRSWDSMNSLEKVALDLSRGRVLDLGAGVGSHALVLQGRGLDVTALDGMAPAVGIMARRGVARPVAAQWEDLPTGPCFDTILLLMNGPGIAGTLHGLETLLRVLRDRLCAGGQILLDSVTLPEVLEAPAGEDGFPQTEDGRYPGELHFQLEYQGVRGSPFPHLFVDAESLASVAETVGLNTELVLHGEDGSYLARLTSR